jgi:hypothetical protein
MPSSFSFGVKKMFKALLGYSAIAAQLERK